jgi:hypothetical protein
MIRLGPTCSHFFKLVSLNLIGLLFDDPPFTGGYSPEVTLSNPPRLTADHFQTLNLRMNVMLPEKSSPRGVLRASPKF